MQNIRRKTATLHLPLLVVLLALGLVANRANALEAEGEMEVQTDETAWIAESDEHALYLMRATAAFDPENAAANGLTEFDAEIFDIGDNYRERFNTLEESLTLELRQRLKKTNNVKVRQDLQILIQSLEDSIRSRSLNAQYLTPYFELHQILFYSFRGILDPRNDPERHAKAIERLRKYAGIEPGYTPVSQLAIARSTETFSNAALIGPYRVQLETDIGDAERLVSGMRNLFESSGLEGWQKDFAQLETQLNDYRDWLRSELLPRARADNRLPLEVYANRLSNFGVRSSPEELIADALYAYQFIRGEMKALAVKIAARRGWEDSELVSVMRRLKKETIADDKILELYRQRLAELELIIEREQLLTLPERDASIRLATEAEAAVVPASFMSPPQLINNTGQYGEFVLVQSNPALGADARMDDWGHDAITWALTAHETRPGHELQFARLVEDGTSIARAIYAFNSANVEGWGLYAEFIVHQFLGEEAQLFSLFSRQMRAARMFLDPMVNLGLLQPEEAVRFMQ
ncbi:MAG: hypothetical protein ACI87W_000312, partial [Halieaceae bacterium]